MRETSIAIAFGVLLLTTTLTLPAAGASDTVTVCPESADSGCDYNSIQTAVEEAASGTTIQVGPGTYYEPVEVTTDDLTIEGAGENVTVLDGSQVTKEDPQNGIYILSDGVTVRGLTVQNFPGNGIYYNGVTGFYVEDASAIANGPYGIYAIRSEVGWIKDSFATEHRDSGFYIGETLACECVLEGLVSKGNLIGYSGTAASHVTIRDSLWKDNAEGIVPNVLPQEPLPQTNLVVTNNRIVDNNNATASEKWHFSDVHVPPGIGVTIAGGSNNLVTENVITGHEGAGVAVSWLFAQPSANRIVDNVLSNGNDDDVAQNGDLPAEVFEDDGVDILWDGGGVNNCFEDNVRPDGDVTFHAGNSAWDAIGTLPECDTPNAGVPSPTALARQLNLMVLACEPGDHLEAENNCHQELV